RFLEREGPLRVPVWRDQGLAKSHVRHGVSLDPGESAKNGRRRWRAHERRRLRALYLQSKPWRPVHESEPSQEQSDEIFPRLPKVGQKSWCPFLSPLQKDGSV